MDRKDEIIRLQMDVISQMTRSNLRRIADAVSYTHLDVYKRQA